MSRFKVGQKVVKIGDWSVSNSIWKGRPINKGETHVIRSITPSTTPGINSLCFEGIYNPHHTNGSEFGYNENEYELVIETRSDFVEVTYTQIKETNPKVSAS